MTEVKTKSTRVTKAHLQKTADLLSAALKDSDLRIENLVKRVERTQDQLAEALRSSSRKNTKLSKLNASLSRALSEIDRLKSEARSTLIGTVNIMRDDMPAGYNPEYWESPEDDQIPF